MRNKKDIITGFRKVVMNPFFNFPKKNYGKV